MVELSLVFGACAMVFFMWQLYDRIDEEKHELLRVLIIFFNVTFFMFIPLVLIGVNVFVTMFKLYLVFYGLFWTYVIAYYVLGILRSAGVMLPKEKK